MKAGTIILVIVIVILVVLGIWFGVVKKASPEAKGPIKIGAILPMSGSLATIGTLFQEGMEEAKEEINQNGGINGRNVEIIYEDSQGDTQLGLTAYHNLKDTYKVQTIIGTMGNVILGIAPLAEQDKTVLLAVGVNTPQVSTAGDFIFRHNIMPKQEIQVMADLIKNKENFSSVGLLVMNNEGGVSYRDEFIKNFEALGGKIAIEEMYTPASNDYKTNLLKIKVAETSAVFCIGYPKDIGLILKQGKELGLQEQWFSSYSAENKDVVQIAGDAANGLIFTSFFNPDSQQPLVADYQEKYRARYGRPSESYAALAYDSIKILDEAIKNCQDPNNSICIKDNLYLVQGFPAVTGNISFDTNGDTVKAIIIKTIQNSQFVPHEVQ